MNIFNLLLISGVTFINLNYTNTPPYHNAFIKSSCPNIYIENVSYRQAISYLDPITCDIKTFFSTKLEIEDDDSGEYAYVNLETEITFEDVMIPVDLGEVTITFEIYDYTINLVDDIISGFYDVYLNISYNGGNDDYNAIGILKNINIFDFNYVFTHSINKSELENLVDVFAHQMLSTYSIEIVDPLNDIYDLRSLADDYYENGYDAGASADTKTAYENGYRDALKDNGGLIGFLKQIFDILIDFGNVELIPGITIWLLMSMPIVFGLIKMLLSIFR